MQKMKPYALCNTIPLGAPATRRPSRDEEPFLRVSLGFCPDWFTKRLGVRFGKKWHEDCLYRYETLLVMKRALHERFPSVEEFLPRLNPRGFEEGCATLSGVHGSKLLCMLYGVMPAYPEDDWPVDADTAHLTKEALSKLRPFNLDAGNPAMDALYRQMDEMRRRFGCIEGYLSYPGVLNVALKLRGNDIFLDMADDPEFVDFLFAHIAQTIDGFASRVQARQRESGFDVDLLSVSNCVVNMVSPAMYRRFILPHDKALSRKYRRFGVHTCNWNVTPYIDALSQIEKMGYIDMGIESDMARVREVFPDARRAVLLSPVGLERNSLERLRQDVARIRDALAPCDIVMADVAQSTPDERVRDFLAIVEEAGAQ